MRVPTAGDARTIFRLGLPAAVVLAGLCLASPAAASTPTDWPDTDPVSTLRALLIFGGIPLALGALIALLTLAPQIARGSPKGDSRTWWGEPVWFGGPAELAESSVSGRKALSGDADVASRSTGSTAVASAPKPSSAGSTAIIATSPDLAPGTSTAKVGGAGARW
ncbi:MAG: hypothetical protein H0V32_03045 [Nocardioidaceae bacterium]|nr:hypothetical protein [Nocardioidaceae bacterium]MDQ3325778.1 hypothetical protein [Actinomycetota bacterium]